MPGTEVNNWAELWRPRCAARSLPAMHEYKVISEKDSTFAGKFDPEAVESALNEHASEGWRLVNSFSTVNLKKFGSEIMFVLERSAPDR